MGFIMKDKMFTVCKNICIAPDVYELTLAGDTCEYTAPGTFANIRINGFYLRRPISVCGVKGDKLVLTYKVVGGGTRALSQLNAGEGLDILGPLGNGYTINGAVQRPLIIAGGLGAPPLLWLCERLVQSGLKPGVILGFNSRRDLFYIDRFKALTNDVFAATADGTYGIKGFVTDVPAIHSTQWDCFYACGPTPMLKALSEGMQIPGQLSFEEHMACGFGACMGCSCKTKSGNKRICTDGPVFEKGQMIFEGEADNG